jgi:hypothetical protein
MSQRCTNENQSYRSNSLESLFDELLLTEPSRAAIGSRRKFLKSLSTGAACVAASAVSMSRDNSAHAADSASEFKLEIARDLNLFRVRMEMDVQGNVNLVKDPMVRDSKKQLLPVTAKLTLDYEERFLRPTGATQDSEIVATERHFHEAVGTSRLNRTDKEVKLREVIDEVIARRENLPETLYSPDDYLTHEEIDLLRTPVASTAVDRLIPEQMMRIGEKVPLLSRDLASFFNLSAIAASDVEIELVSADAGEAKLQMRGKIDGSVSGVPTRMQILGKLTLDRRAGVVSWAAVAIHETREIGKAEPGFDVTATIRMVRKPLSTVQTLPAKPAEIAFDAPPPPDRLLVAMKSNHVGVEGLLDRRWRMMKDAAGEAVLRMIDNDQSIAQLNLRPLPRLAEGEQWTLAAFQQDIRKTLGNRFGELIESHEGVTDSGLRLLRVVVGGQVDEVPIQWIMIHVSDDSRRRVIATWTMDGDSVPKLAGSDIQLAATMRLIAGDKATAETDSKSPKTQKNAEITAVDAMDEVESVAEVASPSDLIVR